MAGFPTTLGTRQYPLSPPELPTPALVNVALLRIGANVIRDLQDGSPNATKVSVVYPFVLRELLQARDWKFAKLRKTLTKSLAAPLYAYHYAYPLPDDFLRLVKPHGSMRKAINPAAYGTSYVYASYLIPEAGHYQNYDPPVYPPGLPYIIEIVPADVTVNPPTADQLCLLTDYNDTAQALYINYIRWITDESFFTPAFTNCLQYRLAQELALAITESAQKEKAMQELYQEALFSSAAVNESYDYQENETGSTDWEMAGR